MSETPSTQTTLRPVEKQLTDDYLFKINTRLNAFPQWFKNQADEILYLRRALEEHSREIFDLTELIGRLATKIEEWVGVAEEQ